MWVLIIILAVGGTSPQQPSTGVATNSIYFADKQHCANALDDMKKAMPGVPTITYLMHCAEVNAPSKDEEHAGDREPTYQKM